MSVFVSSGYAWIVGFSYPRAKVGLQSAGVLICPAAVAVNNDTDSTALPLHNSMALESLFAPLPLLLKRCEVDCVVC
ncbi:MAG: hypothetical protein COB69_00740 [Phycisphaera sp.]|nr:MAG: hypothetical protein COB69_00740 [Phycisphaera sp.]